MLANKTQAAPVAAQPIPDILDHMRPVGNWGSESPAKPTQEDGPGNSSYHHGDNKIADGAADPHGDEPYHGLPDESTGT